MISGPQTKAMYAQAKAPWFSEQPGGDLTAKVVQAPAAHGDLAGRKIAVVGGSQDQSTVEDSMVPALKAAGAAPVTTGYLTSYGSDAAALAQQTTVLLQKAQAAGADTLLITGTPEQTLPAVLEKTTWRPRLLFTDAPTGYLLSQGAHDFSVLTGSVVAAPVINWSDATLQACVTTLEHAVPSLDGKLTDPATAQPGQPTPGISLWTACLGLKLFTAIADKAGPELNYATFQQGFALGRIHLPAYVDDATFSADSTDSAGGNLAAVLAQSTASHGVPLAAQMLVYPAADLALDTDAYPSRTECATGYMFETAELIRAVTSYLGSDADPADPRASPIRGSNLGEAPPALVVTVEYDPLRDEGIAYAEKLRVAGVRVVHQHVSGLVHGTFDLVVLSETARKAMMNATAALAGLLAH